MIKDRNIYKLFDLKKFRESVKKSTDIICHMKAFIIGTTLIIIGFLLIMASAIIPASVSSTSVSSTSTGFTGVIFLGPFPIVIGGGNPSMMPTLLAFALGFTIIALLFYLVPLILNRKTDQ